LLPRDLIHTARDLVRNSSPSDSNLRRATSTTYYALFHTLASTAANMMIGGPKAKKKSDGAWHQVYRAIDHNAAKGACENSILQKFPKEIQDFASVFVAMQKKRHMADYDPHVRITRSEVIADLVIVENAIKLFGKAKERDRRAFAALIMFKMRK